MRKFVASLQFKLMVGFAAVLVLVLGSVGVYARSAAAAEIDRYEEEIVAVREERLETMIRSLLASGRRGPQLEQIIQQAGSLYGLNIAVADATGAVITETSVAPNYAFFGESVRSVEGDGFHRLQPPKDLRPRRGSAFIPLDDNNIAIGAIAFTAAGEDAFIRPEPTAAAIINNVDSFLLWTGLGAGAVAVAISMFVSRRTLSPLRSLQAAAERLGAGDLSQRVPYAGHDEVAEMAYTFNAMAEGLEQAEAQRRGLMADVAHELRTPLANIQGYVEAIRDGVVDADESTIDTLHQQVLHLAHLIEDLRLLALAEAGALPLDPQPTSLADVARTSTEAFRPRAEAKQITLAFNSLVDLPPATIDKERISQVIGNLLENGIRHTPESGSVTVTVEADDDRARVSVADTGSGIPQDELVRIFDRFHRLDPSRARATGGAGLGLTIAKQLVEAHGGTIGVSSTPQGSTFFFDLPLAG